MNYNQFLSKIVSPSQAIKNIKSEDHVYVHANCSYPKIIIDALCENFEDYKSVRMIHLKTFCDVEYVKPKYEGHFIHNSLFVGSDVKNAVNERRADFIPVFLSEIPILIENRKIPIDVCLLHLSPPDEHGYCSLGVSNECSKIAAENSKVIIAQINPKMPRVLGDNFIHLSKIDYIVEVDYSIDEVSMSEKNISKEDEDVYNKIGKYIGGLIEDRSTLQLGIGKIPDAVLPYLKDKKDLGIHTEMFSDHLIELIELGIITGRYKTLLADKVVSSFVLGTKYCFDYIDNNPLIEFRTSKFVNDPFTIARNSKMVSINSALQIDLTGQVCADTMCHQVISGLGGQLDFVRGAKRSIGGKSIIALPSTAKKGSISRIVPYLPSGSAVTTTRGDVGYIITEYGIADLEGKSLRERAKSLIDISHPKFKESLEIEAKGLKLL